MIHFAETTYGFEYGAAKVERVCSDKKRGWIVLMITTPKYPKGVQVYVTKTGKMKINGVEVATHA